MSVSALGYVVAAPAGLVRRLTIALAAAFCLVVLSWVALRFGRLWVSPGEPVIALAAVFAALGVRDFAVERRRRHHEEPPAQRPRGVNTIARVASATAGHLGSSGVSGKPSSG